MSSESIDSLAEQLAPHYRKFDVENRLLFTGHSHQAWPDVALEGLEESFDLAARDVDKKWDTAFEKAEKLREYLREYYDDPDGRYCLGVNTHQLLVSWLSSFDLRKKNKVITTDGEFHSLFRQLHRLEEEGLELVMVEAASDRIVEQIEQSIDDNTAAIMLSRVYFRSALINDHIPDIAKLARNHRIPFLIDDYHGTNVVPLSIREAGLDDCYLLIGGYKYLQWGEGNCFLRFPDDCKLRPAVTGWFASFNTLDKPRSEKEPVAYDEGDQRFASGTYDSVSQFRAARVVDFFREQELTPQRLATQYRRQVGLMRELFVQQQFDKKVIGLHSGAPLHRIGGFLSLRSESAREVQERLLEKGVWTDARGEILRMGPAPYITTRQIEQAMERLSEVVREISP